MSILRTDDKIQLLSLRGRLGDRSNLEKVAYICVNQIATSFAIGELLAMTFFEFVINSEDTL